MPLVRWNPKIELKLRSDISKINYLSLKHYRNSLYGPSHEPSTDSRGAYGTYYKIGRGKGKSSIGIKVIRPSCRKIGGRKNKEHIIFSTTWRDAKEEFNILSKMQSSGFTPIPYAVKPIRIGLRWYAAIFMEHIPGKIYYCGNVGRFNNVVEREAKRLSKIIRKKYNIQLTDHEGHNTIITRDFRVVLIDFSPECVYDLNTAEGRQRARDYGFYLRTL